MKNNQFARVGKVLNKSLSILDRKSPYNNFQTPPKKGLNNQLPYSLSKVG